MLRSRAFCQGFGEFWVWFLSNRQPCGVYNECCQNDVLRVLEHGDGFREDGSHEFENTFWQKLEELVQATELDPLMNVMFC